MADLGEILRKQLISEIGNTVNITQKNGKEVEGRLLEVDTSYITIQSGKSKKTLLVDLIGGWDIIGEDDHQPEPSVQIAPTITPSPQPASPPVPTTAITTIDPQVEARLTFIEEFMSGKIRGASLRVRPPDFAIPAAELKSSSDTLSRAWMRVKDKYSFALKENQLGVHHGRIQFMIGDLKDLVQLDPSSSAFRRHLAYLHFLAGQLPEAVRSYTEAALLATDADDWHNAAAITLSMPTLHEAQAIYTLGRIFYRRAISDDLDAWYRYIGLLRLTDNAPLLRELYEANADALSTEEVQHVLIASIHLLKAHGHAGLTHVLVRGILQGKPQTALLQEANRQLTWDVSTAYVQQELAMDALARQLQDPRTTTGPRLSLRPALPATTPKTSAPAPASSLNGSKKHPATPNTGKVIPAHTAWGAQLHGQIISYNPQEKYGILRGPEERSYTFREHTVVDKDLLLPFLNTASDQPPEPQPVIFEATEGGLGKGLVAVQLMRQRYIDLAFEQALAFANDGDYIKAVTNIKKVVASDPLYPQAAEHYEKWKVFARRAALPHGSNPYARAKRVQMIEKDLEGAVVLFYQAIDQNDTIESAIKDLAALLMQLNRAKEAVEVLERHRSKISEQQPLENLLIDAYQKAALYPQAIALLQKSLNGTTNKTKQSHLETQIASCYLRAEEYQIAEQWFQRVVALGFNSKAIQRNRAFCLMRLQQYDEAEQLLTNNLPDVQSTEMLKVIEQVKTTGQPEQIDEMFRLIDLSNEISPFAHFFLDRCTYEGVPTLIAQEQHFTHEDVRRLEALIGKLGTSRSHDRAEYYLSAAKILSKNHDWEDYNQLYRYLCRSFASRGDAAVIEGKTLDVARAWYGEALSAYDGTLDYIKRDEHDALNAVVRFLTAALGREHIPQKPAGFDTLSIHDNLDKILQTQDHSYQIKIFDAISYLVFHSQFAANRILNHLYREPLYEEMALTYLSSKGIPIPTQAITKEAFIALWKMLQLKDLERARTTSLELRSIANFEFTTASLDSHTTRLQEEVERTLLFDTDRQRVDELQTILSTMNELCRQSAFEERERFCRQVMDRCIKMAQEIEANPTTLSVVDLYPVLQTIREQTEHYLDEIYTSSVPELTLRLPGRMESYATADHQHIEVQIVIENAKGRSPAESVHLIIQEDRNFFTRDELDLKLNGSLRGGEQRIVLVPLLITEQALQSQAFSLTVSAQYGIRARAVEKAQSSQPVQETSFFRFPINLYSSQQFERIINPYSPQSGPVGDRSMFYGRDELIANITEAICHAQNESKSIVVFGQKRSGKSSILYHLQKELERKPFLLVLNLGSLGTYDSYEDSPENDEDRSFFSDDSPNTVDGNSNIPLLSQLLASILSELERAIAMQHERGKSWIEVSFPDDITYYNHPTPLRYFRKLMVDFREAMNKTDDWQEMRIVLLIDEFSYLYDYIRRSNFPVDFMRNWKAILQENLFSVVLAGQDVMPQFKELFPNEFGTSQYEHVSYLQTEYAVRLIDEPILIGGRQGDSRYRERAIERILSLTAGSPYYIQIICSRLVEYMNRKQTRLVTEADVEQVKAELIEGPNRLSWAEFDNLTNSGDLSPEAISEEDAIVVLRRIAKICHDRAQCHKRNITDADSSIDVDKVLKNLVDRDVIEVKQGEYYAIRVGLFTEWLQAQGYQ